MEQLSHGWWPLEPMRDGECFVFRLIKGVPLVQSSHGLFFLHCQMATACLCPSCTFKLWLLCNRLIHLLNIFWCLLSVTHHTGLCWGKNECDRQLSVIMVPSDRANGGGALESQAEGWAVQKAPRWRTWVNEPCTRLCLPFSLISQTPQIPQKGWPDRDLSRHPGSPWLPSCFAWGVIFSFLSYIPLFPDPSGAALYLSELGLFLILNLNAREVLLPELEPFWMQPM